MKFTLNFPGGSVRVSKVAAELAVAVDKMSLNPVLARQLAPAIAAIKNSAAVLDNVERMSGRARLNELVEQTFSQP